MAERSVTDLRGWLIRDRRISHANLKAKGAGSTDSAYTQAGARTGTPEAVAPPSSLSLLGSGAMDADGSLELRTQVSGTPGDGWTGFVWRDIAAGHTTSQYLGRDAPQLLTGFEVIRSSTGATDYSPVVDGVATADGRALFVVSQSTVSGQLILRRYAASTGLWSSLTFTPDVTLASALSVRQQYGPALTIDRDGRLLLAVTSSTGDNVDIYRSDDGSGDDFARLSLNALRTRLVVADAREMSMAVDVVTGAICLFVAYRDGGGRAMAQYVSYDDGASFDEVDGDLFPSDDPEFPCVRALPGGGFVAAYLDNDASTSVARVGTLGHAGSSLADATTTAPHGSGASSATITSRGLSVHVDDGGRLWLYTDSVDAVSLCGTATSSDRGSSWTLCHSLWSTDDAPTHTTGGYPHSWRAVPCGGRVLFVTRWSSTSDTRAPYSTACMYLAGHSQHTGPDSNVYIQAQVIATYDITTAATLAWGRGLEGGAWLPFGTPASMAWTVTGAGSMAADGTVTTVAQQAYATRTMTTNLNGPLGTGPLAWFGHVALVVTSGGSKASNAIAYRARLSDSDGAVTATFIYEVSIQFDGTGYRMYDEIAGAHVGAAVTVDCTTEIHVRLAIDSNGNVRNWYGRSAHDREWTAGTDGTLTDDSGTNPGNTSRVEWGHIASSSAVSVWSMAGYCSWAFRWGPTSQAHLAAGWTNPSDLRAREYDTEPALISSGAYIRAAGGLTTYAERFTVQPTYDYGIDRIHPEVDPSRGGEWRSIDDGTAVHLVYDLSTVVTTALMESTSIGVVLLGANFRLAYLEGWDGAAWQSVIDLDAASGLTGLRYTRTGEQVVVDTGGASSATSWLYRGASVGDTFRASATKLRVIGRQTGGGWTAGTTARPRLSLDGVDGTEPASATDGAIWRRNFGAVVHEWTATYEQYRLRIPAQDTAHGDFRLRKMIVGPLVVVGHEWDRNWSATQERPMVEERLASGRSRVRSIGPKRRRVELTWADTAIDATKARQSLGLADYPTYTAGSDTGLPIAVREDTVEQVEALADELSEAGTTGVLLMRIPRGTGSLPLVEPDLIVYGRLSSQTRRDVVLGSEGRSEVWRLNAIVTDEEP